MAQARTVLVTGGNRGIGFAIAQQFVIDGHRVAVTARSGEGPEGSVTVRADVTDGDSLDQALAVDMSTLSTPMPTTPRRYWPSLCASLLCVLFRGLLRSILVL